MSGCCICLCDCAFLCLPIAWRCDGALTKFYLTIWLLVNCYVLLSPESVSTEYFYEIYINTGLITLSYYGLTVTSVGLVSLLCRIASTGRSYRTEKPFLVLNTFHMILMFFTLSSLPPQLYYILQLSPILSSIIYEKLTYSNKDQLYFTIFIWCCCNLGIYFTGTVMNVLLAVLWWGIIPGFEYFIIATILLCSAIYTYETLRRTKHRNIYGNKNQVLFFSTIYFNDAILMLAGYLGLAFFEIILYWIHGTTRGLISFGFTCAYMFPFAELMMYKDTYSIHKCNEHKERQLNFASIAFSTYVVRFLINF